MTTELLNAAFYNRTCCSTKICDNRLCLLLKTACGGGGDYQVMMQCDEDGNNVLHYMTKYCDYNLLVHLLAKYHNRLPFATRNHEDLTPLLKTIIDWSDDYESRKRMDVMMKYDQSSLQHNCDALDLAGALVVVNRMDYTLAKKLWQEALAWRHMSNAAAAAKQPAQTLVPSSHIYTHNEREVMTLEELERLFDGGVQPPVHDAPPNYQLPIHLEALRVLERVLGMAHVHTIRYICMYALIKTNHNYIHRVSHVMDIIFYACDLMNNNNDQLRWEHIRTIVRYGVGKIIDRSMAARNTADLYRTLQKCLNLLKNVLSGKHLLSSLPSYDCKTFETMQAMILLIAYTADTRNAKQNHLLTNTIVKYVPANNTSSKNEIFQHLLNILAENATSHQMCIVRFMIIKTSLPVDYFYFYQKMFNGVYTNNSYNRLLHTIMRFLNAFMASYDDDDDAAAAAAADGLLDNIVRDLLVFTRQSCMGESLLHLVCIHHFEPYIASADVNTKRRNKLITLLLKYGADPDAVDHLGNTVLHSLILYNCTAVSTVRLLMDVMSDTDRVNLVGARFDEYLSVDQRRACVQAGLLSSCRSICLQCYAARVVSANNIAAAAAANDCLPPSLKVFVAVH